MTVITIPAADGLKKLRFKAGITKNIINEVMQCYLKNRNSLKDFAPTLQAATVEETARNIWQFVKYQINYLPDPAGVQWVKTPARLWADKSGDCKSFSVFAASCLHCLGIPVKFRFTSYDSSNSNPTHVYCFIPLADGREIIVDAVWHRFNSQKRFVSKTDLPRKKTQ